jgi:hypothetical protein
MAIRVGELLLQGICSHAHPHEGSWLMTSSPAMTVERVGLADESLGSAVGLAPKRSALRPRPTGGGSG